MPQYRTPQQYGQPQSPQQYRQQYEPQMRYQRPMGYYQSRYGQPQGYRGQYGGGGYNPYQNRLAAMSRMRNYDQGRRNQYSNAMALNERRRQTYGRPQPQQSSGGGGGRSRGGQALELITGLPGLSKLF